VIVLLADKKVRARWKKSLVCMECPARERGGMNKRNTQQSFVGWQRRGLACKGAVKESSLILESL